MTKSSGITADRQIVCLKAAEARYERAISGARGLCLIVYPTGTKTFVLRYVAVGGERRRLPLGNYPGLSLAEARERAAAHQVDVVEGADPVEARAIAKEAARTGETLEELAEAYWRAAAVGLHGGRRRPKRERTLQNERSLWKTHIQDALGQRRFAELRRADVKIFMRDLALEGKLRPASIASVGGVLSNILGFAVHEDRIEANPALGLTRPLAWESRSRLFDVAALTALWATLDEAAALREKGEERGDPHARMGPQMALALQFLILTLSRRTEVAGARWSEIDLAAGTWTIPAERTKPKRVHIVPLSPAAAQILQKATGLAGQSQFIFPSPKDPGQHLDPRALTRAITRLCKRLGLPPGSPHDFRRSGATTLTGERYGIRRFIVGKVLSHDPKEGSAVTAVYDRNEYLPEKRAALVAWASHVLELQSAPEDQARAA